MPKKYLSLLVFICFVAAAVRLWNLGQQSVWFDEGWSAYAASQTGLIAAASADATNPPLYYMLLNAFARVAGESVFTLRWMSFAFGMLALALSVRFAAVLFDARTGLMTGFLGLFSGPMWWAAQEMRMYTLMACCVLLAAWGWHRLPRRSGWLMVLGAELALLYTHNTGPVIVLWLNAVTLLAWIVAGKRPFNPPLVPWVAGQIGVLVFWGPYFALRFLNVAGANQALIRRTAPEFAIWESLWVAPYEAVGQVGPLRVYSWIVLLVLLVTFRWRVPAARWLSAHVVLLVTGVLTGLAVLGNEFHGRYLVMVLPLLLILVAAGLSRGAWRSGLVSVFALGFVANLWIFYNTPGYAHDDARGMVQHYADTLTPDDTVVAWSYADRYELAYYWDRLGVAAERVTLPEGADMKAVLPLLPDSGDVSLNVWFTQRADYRGMLPCLLGHGTVQTPDILQVNGMETHTYRNISHDVPVWQPHEAQFTVATVEQVGALPRDFQANQAICVPVQIMLTAPTFGELKAALIVRNHLGQEIARADSVFATANQRASVDVFSGAALAAFPLLRLPPAAPSGSYDVYLRVYDEVGASSGYDLLREGAPAGKDLLLGTWQVAPGASWTQAAVEAARASLSPVDETPLLAMSPEGGMLRNGDHLDMTLLWETAPPPDLTLQAGSWTVPVPAVVEQASDVPTLEWRRAQVPVDAPDSVAQLLLPDGSVVARYEIQAVPAVYTPPPFEVSMEETYPDLGMLVGYTLSDNEVVLVWQAADTAPPDRDYTVFVQWIGEDGQVVTQSDVQPQRATSGWRPGEYILSSHRLDAPESGQLIAGLYDEEGRLRLLDGKDHIVLMTR